jgi:hypothetical protein
VEVVGGGEGEGGSARRGGEGGFEFERAAGLRGRRWMMGWADDSTGFLFGCHQPLAWDTWLADLLTRVPNRVRNF